MRIPLRCLTIFLLAAHVSAHGMLNKPAARAVVAHYGNAEAGMLHGGLCEPNRALCGWNGFRIFPKSGAPLPQTIPDSALGWKDLSPYDPKSLAGALNFVPWKSPGQPLSNPCGSDENGRDMTELPRTPGAVWHRGSAEEVAYAITANHGGGSAFRLCPLDANTTEECFQQQHLEFAGNTSWIQWGNDAAGRVPFRATRLDKGTMPKGSQWTQNPVPGCVRKEGGCPKCFYNNPPQYNTNDTKVAICKYGVCDPECACPPPKFNAGCDGPDFNGTQFPSPAAGVSGGAAWAWPGITSPQWFPAHSGMNYSIVDLVKVPASLKPGNYLLSWRYDAENSQEVFANCADVTVV